MYLTGVPRCDVILLDHIIEAGDENYSEHKVLIIIKTKISTTDHTNQLSINRTFLSSLFILTPDTQLAEATNLSLTSSYEVETILSEFRIPAIRNIIDKILDGINVMAQRRECFDQEKFCVLRMVVELDLLVHQLPNIPANYEDDVITQTYDIFYVRSKNSDIYSDFSFHDHGSLLVEAVLEAFGENLVPDEMDIDFFDGYEIMFEASSEEAIENLEVIVVSEVKSCTVCLGDIEVGSAVTLLPCSHFFHGNCIVEWLRTSKYCPMCRLEI